MTDPYLWNNFHNNMEITWVTTAPPVPAPLHRNPGKGGGIRGWPGTAPGQEWELWSPPVLFALCFTILKTHSCALFNVVRGFLILAFDGDDGDAESLSCWKEVTMNKCCWPGLQARSADSCPSLSQTHKDSFQIRASEWLPSGYSPSSQSLYSVHNGEVHNIFLLIKSFWLF